MPEFSENGNSLIRRLVFFWHAVPVTLARACLCLIAGFFAVFLILLTAGASPVHVILEMADGALGSKASFFMVIHVFCCLVLAVSGLLVSFTAGLWNIGMEGQIGMGAIAAVGIMRALTQAAIPPWAIVLAGFLVGAGAGAAWAWLTGFLKTAGRVHEIFGGLGLNYLATALAVWLVFGPWKRPGTGSMSGTEPFPASLDLPCLPGGDLSPWTLAIAAVAFSAVVLLLRLTSFGLRLKAVGVNPRAAERIGIPGSACIQSAFLVCGLSAGLLGALQVTAVHHKLLPAISGNYGYLGLLVVILAGYRPFHSLAAALFFAIVVTGAIRLPLVFQIDSAFAGVLINVLILAVLGVSAYRGDEQHRASARDRSRPWIH